ncbi:MAG: zinc-dependent alcohol dehydrogenase family protein [Magnetovibrio sp.]|nr:zinc-dependent alcohol dehydrogenase family protein [Magnetovibrio sp.]
MRAAVLRMPGLKRPYADSRPLQIEELALDGPADGEILVEIAAAGLCHSDLSTIEGIRPRPLPAVLGHEAAGVVREVGPGVADLAVDDHVVMVFVMSCGGCADCLGGRPNLCGESSAAKAKGEMVAGGRRLHLNGETINHAAGISCFAEYAVVDRRSVVKLPADVPLDDAALFGCAVVTGVGAVLNTAAVPEGASAAVVGLGGVGLNAVMGAAIAGAEPLIAVDVHEDKLALAVSLGATHGIDAGAPTALEEIRDLTGGGVQHAFDMAGTVAAFETAYAMLRPGGVLTSAGLAPAAAEFAFKPYEMVSQEKRIQGSYMGSCTPSRDIPRFIEYYREGRLPVNRLHSGELGLDAINGGFDRLSDGAVVRQILRPRLS